MTTRTITTATANHAALAFAIDMLQEWYRIASVSTEDATRMECFMKVISWRGQVGKLMNTVPAESRAYRRATEVLDATTSI